MTRQEAEEKFNTMFWKHMSYKEKVKFQTNEDMLCMPIGVYMEALENVLNRPVYTHEIIDPKLKEEINNVV